MPFAVGDIIEVVPLCTQTVQTAYNIYHAKVTAQVGLGATEAEIASDLSNSFAIPYKTCLSNAATYYGAYVKKILPAPAGFLFGSTTGNGVGLTTGDLLPKQTCGLITLLSAVAGRSGRGRSYIPFPGEFDNGINSRPTLAYGASLQVICNLWLATRVVASIINPGASTTIRYGVLSKTLGVFNLAASAICRTIWATQRKRGDSGRPNVPAF